MEKKYPPRVWLPDSAIQAFSKRMSMLDQKHFISVEEHQALIAPLVEALKRISSHEFTKLYEVTDLANKTLKNMGEEK